MSTSDPRAGRASESPRRTMTPAESSWTEMSGGVPRRPASAVTVPLIVTRAPTLSRRASAIEIRPPDGTGVGLALGGGVGLGGSVGVGDAVAVGVGVGDGLGVGDGAGVGVAVGRGVA